MSPSLASAAERQAGPIRFRMARALDRLHFGQHCWVTRDERFVLFRPSSPSEWVDGRYHYGQVLPHWEIQPRSRVEGQFRQEADFLRAHGLLGQRFSSRTRALDALSLAYAYVCA